MNNGHKLARTSNFVKTSNAFRWSLIFVPTFIIPVLGGLIITISMVTLSLFTGFNIDVLSALFIFGAPLFALLLTPFTFFIGAGAAAIVWVKGKVSLLEFVAVASLVAILGFAVSDLFLRTNFYPSLPFSFVMDWVEFAVLICCSVVPAAIVYRLFAAGVGWNAINKIEENMTIQKAEQH